MKILIVDGYQLMREKMIKYLELRNSFDSVFEANTVRNAKLILIKEKIDFVLLDIQLPDTSGLDLVQYSQKLFYRPITILCSNYGLPQYLNTYNNLSVDYFLDKSSELHQLKMLINNLVDERRGNYKIKRRQKVS